MLDEVIRRLLALHPRGATGEQLLWRLRRGAVRVDASELLGALTRLSDTGETELRLGRWHLRRSPPEAQRRGDVQPGHAEPTGRLAAVPARLTAVGEAYEAAADADGTVMQAEWGPLLTYYAATQRQDPRGSIACFPDQHGGAWQLFSCRGAWWAGHELEFPASLLPPSLREALSRTRGTACALGWPVTLFQADTGPLCAPALIVPASWVLEADRLLLRPEATVPALNPTWLREIRRLTAWGETALREALFPEGEEEDLGAVARRLAHALATRGGGGLRPAELAAELDVAARGLSNSAALFLPDDATFTRGVARDLEAMREWPPAKRRLTALATLLDGVAAELTKPPPLIAPHPMTLRQREAAETALAAPLTSLQGPPGTGKSQVIVALIVSAVLARRSVLFVARNHQALDEVEGRLAALAPDVPLIVRGRDAEGTRDTGMADVLSDLANGDVADAEARRLMQTELSALAEKGAALADWHANEAERRRLDLELCDLTERLTPDAIARSVRIGLADRLRAILHRLTGQGVTFATPDVASPRDIAARIRFLRRRLARLPPAGEPPDLPDIAALLGRVGTALTRPLAEEQTGLAQRHAQLAFLHEHLAARHLGEEDARAILAHRPVWAVSSLAVPGRIPLVPGLFDYAIFDEASQSDIASALPVLARARRAVIVGDPQQLAFVPALGRAQERALMDAARLPEAGRAAFAQSRTSLFTFVRRSPAVKALFLPDQFRSAPAIVAHISKEFYAGSLIARREEASLRAPAQYRPGLAWEDVPGEASRHDGGNINASEARRVIDLVAQFGGEAGFEGSVGVVSPFNAQVALIRRLATSLPAEVPERLELKVDTVDKWQGGEADVILFSLVLAPGAAQSARTFLAKERRRLNVAISRARALCLIVGHLSHARTCGIAPIERLARAATTPWAPPRAPFDSPWERRLDTALRARGLEPHPQYPVGSRYLDFALFEGTVKLDVEVDGRRWHAGPDGERKTDDRLRDREMIARGWRVRRFWVHELAHDMEGCLDLVEHDLGRR